MLSIYRIKANYLLINWRVIIWNNFNLAKAPSLRKVNTIQVNTGAEFYETSCLLTTKSE